MRNSLLLIYFHPLITDIISHFIISFHSLVLLFVFIAFMTNMHYFHSLLTFFFLFYHSSTQAVHPITAFLLIYFLLYFFSPSKHILVLFSLSISNCSISLHILFNIFPHYQSINRISFLASIVP